MIRLVADLDSIADSYLRQLNLAFPGWGGEPMFDWCFRRRAGGPAADLLVAQDEAGAMIAGSAIVYRRARRTGGAAPEPIACMTGSWTAPAARGRGLFRATIEASLEQAAGRGCRLLIAFAAMTNPSARALSAAGATLVPSYYLQSPPAGSKRRDCASPDEAAEAFSALLLPSTHARLVYEPVEWRGQFVERPHPVRALRLRDGPLALVESAPRGDRLLDVATLDREAFAESAALAASGSPLSAFTLDPLLAEALVARGFTTVPGGLFLLATGEGGGPGESWHFANGDRM